MLRGIPRPVIFAVVLLALPVLSLWAWPWFGLGMLPGIRVGEFELPASGSVDNFLSEKARLWAEESLTVEAGYHVWHPTRAELGASLSVEDAQEAIARVGRSPSPFVAVFAWIQGAFGAGHRVRWRARVTQESAVQEFVQRVVDEVDRLPIPGSFDPDGKPIDGLPGEAVDPQEVERALRAALARNATKLHVATIVTPAPHSRRRFSNPVSDASVLMVRQETNYRPGQGRATNIELAAKKIDGTLVMPGAVLSFNQVVGKRDAARGFAPALELMNGEVVEGVGGGVCQVAGTLHAAAFFAGLIVEEYRPHSRLNQFAYLRPGLDTMVAWPDHATDLSETKDMRVRNPYPFPIVVRASTERIGPGQGVLRVDLYGAAKPFRVDFSFQELERVPASEIRRPDPTVARGEERVQQQPLDGIVILRSRTIFMPTGRVEEETKVAYPPTPKIVLVGA
ncbi:MAG: VanW family protein [Myxococcales bacterium]